MKFDCILADPPWEYTNKNTGGSLISSAEKKYKVMDLETLKGLNKLISNVTNPKGSVLFLWSTAPLLPEGIELMKAWGYKYKTYIVWRKIMSLGLGFWFRGQVELLLFGIKGNVPAFRCQYPNFIQSKAEKHSIKPLAAYNLIERSVYLKIKDPKYLELFARCQYKNWTCIGNELTGNDIQTDLETLVKNKSPVYRPGIKQKIQLTTMKQFLFNSK